MESSEALFHRTVSQLEQLYGKNEAQSLTFLLIEDVYRISRAEILAGKNISTDEDATRYQQYLNRLIQQEPLQYILGHTEFYGLPFKVNPSVLIPRQETEELVHLILAENKHIRPLSILDIGTGSGCIPVSLKKNIPTANVMAIDISEAALATAKNNALLNEAEVIFIQQDILSGSAIPATDIIVSNPPYVTQKEKSLMQENVLAHEPHLALFVEDHDPLLFYRTITQKAKQFLLPNGKLYFEINEQFGQETADLLIEAGFVNVKILKDLHDKDRIVRGEKSSNA